jgi:hypothetical protein
LSLREMDARPQRPPKTAAARLVERVDAAFDWPFGSRANP